MSAVGATMPAMTGEGRGATSLESGRQLVPLWDAGREPPKESRARERETRAADPIEVEVWIDCNRSRYKRFSGVALAWTQSQVYVRYVDDNDREGTGWVWANAVRRA